MEAVAMTNDRDVKGPRGPHRGNPLKAQGTGNRERGTGVRDIILKSAVCLLIAILAIPFVTGCGIINTGPKMVETTLEQSAGVTKALMQAYQPDETTVALYASVNDPTYETDVFVGAGTLVHIVATLKGADVSARLDSSGHGIETDPQLRKEVLTIIGNGLLSEQERLDALTEAILDWLARTETTTPATNEPASEPESEGQAAGDRTGEAE
jgi:hypothetical protein